MTSVTFIGAYEVDVPKKEYDVALMFSGDAALVEKELSSLALVELEVENADEDFDLTFVKQSHTECVPYDETYYHPVSLAPIYSSQPTLRHVRVAFFLHFYDADQVLKTPWGDLRCKNVGPLPRHLVQKKYTYWR